MNKQVLVQFRVDETIKAEVTNRFELWGLDLPMALRKFLARSFFG